jgi:hypothetical protein
LEARGVQSAKDPWDGLQRSGEERADLAAPPVDGSVQAPLIPDDSAQAGCSVALRADGSVQAPLVPDDSPRAG